ncbi:DUF294 nucleotidyltransferase-like domain-containing protein [Halioxenophilus sp. WMMB6]|uniref:DUF294 nucleotidyltransferase-like domain-containing protein n=1 Tax=Halioxenophilus sp. WMMB6 TaxID=3073815 RepID=UPI00295EFA52|nr:DUF294 nucleotidyltransferase-like domain-containing protein [Halioxenophilus sp. WMMB6]
MATPRNDDLRLVTNFLDDCLPFDELPAEELDRLATQLLIQYQRQGDQLNSEQSKPGLRILRSGAVELYDSDEQLIERLAEGDSFNLHGLAEKHSGTSAEFIEDSLVYFLPMADYQALRSNHRHIDRYFRSQRSRRLRRSVRQISAPEYLSRRLASLMSRKLVSVGPEQSVQAAAKLMTAARVSSALVLADDQLLGIITDRDLRSRVVAAGLPMTTAVSEVMTITPKTLPDDASVFDATLFMTEKGIHHIPVTQAVDGKLAGIITTSDLMLARQNDPVFLVTHVHRQTSVRGLVDICQQLPQLMSQWISAGGRAHQASRLLTAISDAVTRRLIELAIAELGPAPVPFCWLGFGSQGRGEQLLGADQDNGLLINDSMRAEHEPWFKALAERVCDGLNECGYPYCNGLVMATTDQWRQPLQGWCKTVDQWTRSPTKDAVMRVSIFFDLRAVYGDEQLAQSLQAHMLKRSQGNSIFLAALTENALDVPAPLGLFRNLVVERSGEHRNELDLKLRAIAIIVDIARIHALAHGLTEVNTYARLKKLMLEKKLALSDSRNLQDAWNLVMQLRAENQAEQIAQGEKVSNYVNPDKLSKLMKRQLRDAFSVIADAEQGIAQTYRPGMAR